MLPLVLPRGGEATNGESGRVVFSFIGYRGVTFRFLAVAVALAWQGDGGGMGQVVEAIEGITGRR